MRLHIPIIAEFETFEVAETWVGQVWEGVSMTASTQMGEPLVVLAMPYWSEHPNRIGVILARDAELIELCGGPEKLMRVSRNLLVIEMPDTGAVAPAQK